MGVINGRPEKEFCKILLHNINALTLKVSICGNIATWYTFTANFPQSDTYLPNKNILELGKFYPT